MVNPCGNDIIQIKGSWLQPRVVLTRLHVVSLLYCLIQGNIFLWAIRSFVPATTILSGGASYTYIERLNYTRH